MIIPAIDNNQWQEWMFRGGCSLLIVSIHLWLLFLLQNENDSLWASSHSSNSSTLSLSFSSSMPTPKVKAVASIKVDSEKKFYKKAKNKKTLSNEKATIEPIKHQKNTVRKSHINSVSKDESLFIESEKRIKESKEIANTAQNEPINPLVNETISEKENSVQTVVYKPSLAVPPIPPRYPEIARRKRQQGTVWLDVQLDKQGQQRQLAVYKSSGVSALDKAAIHAVMQWKFSEYQENYQAQLVTIRIPIEFSLN